MSEAEPGPEPDSDADPGAETGAGTAPTSGGETGAGTAPSEEATSGARSRGAADPTVWGGKRFVMLIYVSLVAVTGVFGYIIGLARPENLDPRLFGVVPLPPTPAGVALYGMVTVALVLGVLLAGVNYVSKRYDTAAVDSGGPK